MAKSANAEKLKKGDRLYLVDGSSYIFRAYHALPPLTRKSDGLPVGAVSGFCNMLWKLLIDIGDPAVKQFGQPTHFAVIFDPKGGSFRNNLYPEYKANRGEPPEDLVPQFPIIRDAVRAFGVPCVEQSGFEADDLIATYAREAEQRGADTVIISSDKDLMQLVSDHITMYDTMKSRKIDRDQVFEKFGVGPEGVIDVQALAGDSSDNIPGVPGIGVKTAALLLQEFGDLENLLANASSIKQNKRRENLIEFADQARLSKELVTLKTDVAVEEPIDSFFTRPIDKEALIKFLQGMEFTSLTKRVGGPKANHNNAGGNQAVMSDEKSAPTSEVNRDAYKIIFSGDELELFLQAARDSHVLAIDTETTSLNVMAARLVGISLCPKAGMACYIPLAHGGDGLALEDEFVSQQMKLEDVQALLNPILQDRSILKIGQNIKYDLTVLTNHGFAVASYDDTMLMSYALSCGLHNHGMDELSKRYLGHEPIKFADIAGTGKKQKTFDMIPIKEAGIYAAEDADITLRLHEILSPRLTREHMQTVYQTLERPMAAIIAGMEQAGVLVDIGILKKLSDEFAERMGGYEKKAHELAGEEFNIASPKQIGEILFGKLGLPGGKKTAKGAWSTDAEVLDGLAAEGVEIAQNILDHRSLAKLKGTYTDALQEAVNAKTGRIHTSYSLAATSTGRLSSNEPNLQNIPIRSEDGRKIRTAFIAAKGAKLISADYSQIELRLLAHIADLPSMKQAFAEGIDIHAMTASEMFGVPVKDMDPMVRRRAKAINFGIIYGISAFGLANQLGISRTEAKDYIASYFQKFPGIRAYMDETIAKAKAQGFVETIFGRKTHVPGINSKNGAQRAYAERQAINAPIQGSAADVIRRAMIRMPEALRAGGSSATMLLQVHDELIFECPDSEIEKSCALVAQVMEGACAPVLQLSVPLVVEAKAGVNWDEAH